VRRKRLTRRHRQNDRHTEPMLGGRRRGLPIDFDKCGEVNWWHGGLMVAATHASRSNRSMFRRWHREGQLHPVKDHGSGRPTCEGRKPIKKLEKLENFGKYISKKFLIWGALVRITGVR
jgi:hypothetical protein